MTFEKKFPSLMKKVSSKRLDGSLMRPVYIHLLYEGGMDDSCGCPEKVIDADYVSKESVEKYLLDKQVVKKAFETIISLHESNEEGEK